MGYLLSAAPSISDGAARPILSQASGRFQLASSWVKAGLMLRLGARGPQTQAGLGWVGFGLSRVSGSRVGMRQGISQRRGLWIELRH